MDDVARLVAHDLDLDVPRVLDEPLDEDVSVAERLDGLRVRPLELVGHLVEGAHHPHAPAAPAERRLEDDGHAVRLAELDGLFGGGDGLVDETRVT